MNHLTVQAARTKHLLILVHKVLFFCGHCFMVQKMALTPEREREFAEKLSELCRRYEILLKAETVRREAPTWPYVLVEYELCAKVETRANVTALSRV